MSRIGQTPIEIPANVKITFDEPGISVEGPKGKLDWTVPAGNTVKVGDGKIEIERLSNQKTHKSLHGLTRSLIANMVEGVTKGFEKKLRVVGTGYRAEISNQKSLVLNVGYSHPVTYDPPEGITIRVDSTENVDGQLHTPVTVSGVDKQLVGQVAASIRQIKKPGVYQPCKGIRYEGERVRMKEGKAKT
ncbi:MAG: 50S ribosomal protein L6 [Candidatus Poribacteria bacterium]|nr:50S ribosomal protein L6 [Candidatus Poribacteria bacterium]MDE0504635.1 50S ribosomal protein L6 [Candidatus Poribacteria bacterium]